MPPKKPESGTHIIFEATIQTGTTSKIDIIVDDRKVSIEVPAEVKAYFNDQFSRPNPTSLQRRKYATIMSLMRAAYLQGRKDK